MYEFARAVHGADHRGDHARKPPRTLETIEEKADYVQRIGAASNSHVQEESSLEYTGPQITRMPRIAMAHGRSNTLFVLFGSFVVRLWFVGGVVKTKVP